MSIARSMRAQSRTLPSNPRKAVHTVREPDPFQVCKSLSQEDYADLEQIHRELTSGAGKGAAQWVFARKRDGTLAAGNFVGIITTRRGRAVEILPKIDLGDQPEQDYETTRSCFLKMLRWHRGLAKAAHLPDSSIRGLRRFPMLEVFVLQFLKALNALVRGGIARRYRPVEENLPHLRGRILFREHLRENPVNQARFYVSHDEFSVNRPANRLIHSALARLRPQVRGAENRQLLQELTAAFSVVPGATSLQDDWRRHRLDRSMRHYEPVMQWVGLFLFNRGLTTFAGRHVNLSLLFPMEEVFEDFVTRSFRRYQDQYAVTSQGPREYLATFNGQNAFMMKSDISLLSGDRVAFILDAKWKRINGRGAGPKHDINQTDMYQLYTYGKRYGCRTVALVYPQTQTFKDPLRYRFLGQADHHDNPTLICLPFDVANPQDSVRNSISNLTVAVSESN